MSSFPPLLEYFKNSNIAFHIATWMDTKVVNTSKNTSKSKEHRTRHATPLIIAYGGFVDT
jgi:hypothetical protein